MTLITLLLSILKIAFYIVAALLALAVILLSVVLFWEIKYVFVCRISENLSFNARVTWILKILRLTVDYSSKEELKTDLRVFWFKLQPRPAPKKPAEEAQKKPAAKEKSGHKPQNAGEKVVEVKSPEVNANETNEVSKTHKSHGKKVDKKETKKALKADNEGKEKTPGDKKSFFAGLREKADKVSYIINYPDRDILIKEAMIMVGRFKKAFRKCTVKIYGELGFEDPALTGGVLGAVYAVTGIVGLDTALVGDFEHKTVDVKIESRGKIRLWSFVWPLILFIFSKPVWKIVKKFLFGKEEE